jgi:hypothetical protein
MSSTSSPHPDCEVLLRLVDDDLEIAERQRVDAHLGECRICQRELDSLREALEDFQEFHAVLKTALPAAQKPWDRLEVRAPRRRRVVPLRWVAAVAAAVAAVLLVVVRFGYTPGVSAAELLRRASAAEQAAPARTHAARLRARSGMDVAAMRRLLARSGYGPDDPLSARTFARWHDRLREKRDTVGVLANAYVIHTITASNPISGASLSLRAADLHAVAGTLEFGTAETIEMSEAQEESAPPLHVAPRQMVPNAPPVTLPERLATASEELQVLAALHRIAADLGEPIDVQREGGEVVVNVTGLDPHRLEEVQTAVSGVPAARVHSGGPRSEEGRETSRRPPPQVDTADPLLTELQAASAGGVSTAELSDRLTDVTEKLIERVYAMRGLARRFPADITSQMSAADIATLDGILRDHTATAADAAGAIRHLLAPVLAQSAMPATATEGTWQEIALALPSDARRLDQALHTPGASDDAAGRKRRAAQSLAEIEARLARLRARIQP